MINNLDNKIEMLKALVRDAAKPRNLDYNHAPFEARPADSEYIYRLCNALETTDALYVLNHILNEEKENN